MIDVEHQISAVSRQVGSRVLAAGEARVVTVAQIYDAAVDDVWDACTSAERINRWFLPVSGDLRVGGRYQIQGNASGTLERCEPPHGFSATWEYGGEVSWIEVSVSARPDGRTRFQLEHIAHVDDERWAQFGPGAVGVGWDLGLVGLALHLSGGPALDPQEGAAWAASSDGHRFIMLSSERWGAADTAAGTPETDARGAADRTTAFYTGVAEAVPKP